MFKLLILLLFNFSNLKIASAKSGRDGDGGKSSLVFVFDTTGSMYNDLKQLREGAEMILDAALGSENVISNFVFVPFHDPAVGPATVTRDKEVFKSALNRVHVYGGGDCPEMSLSGLQLALNVSLPRSYVYLFTDASAADHTLVTRVLDQVQRKQSQVVFVLTGNCNDTYRQSYKVYQQIAAASSGQIFNLNKTSVHNVLDFVRSSISDRMVNLGSVVNPAGRNYIQDIPVDSTLGEVTVSVSGTNPQIRVVNPSGEELHGPPKLVRTLDLSEIMVVKVLEPEPGNWTITVKSERDYSVKLVGLSNLTFQHGFSVQKPKFMNETSHRPLQGTDNYLMIKLTQVDKPLKIDFAEIVTLDGRTLFELRLHTTEDGLVYLADAFLPPESFFYIAINGHDENGQELRRVGATAIQANIPSVPYLTVPKQIEVRSHERVVLRCGVESLVPLSAQWMKDTATTQNPVSSVQSTIVDYVIDDVTEDKTGSYRCIAHNVAGISKAVTDVSLLVDPPQVTIEPGNITIFSGEYLNISCRVYSETDLRSFYMKLKTTNNSKVLSSTLQTISNGYYHYSKIIEVKEKDSHVFACHATNKGGEGLQRMSVEVLPKPIVSIPIKILTVKMLENVKVVCHTENADTVQWMAPNNSIVMKTRINADKYDSILNINNASVIDEGTWKCLVFKRSLKVSDTVNFVVTIKPIVNIEGPKTLTLYYSSKHIIQCKIIANPLYIVVWNHGTDLIKSIPIPVESQRCAFISSWIIENVTELTEGGYSCSASNVDGTNTDNLFIEVVKNMTVIEAPTNKSVEVYKSTHLNCHVDSYPLAKIKWHHNGTYLVPSQNVQLIHNDTTVRIKRIDFENTGIYSCEAVNKYQKILLAAKLSVHGLERPLLEKSPNKIEVEKGKSTKISCRVLQGKPPPELLWKSGDDNTKYMNTTYNTNTVDLIISKAGLNHSGIYMCVAKNAVGDDYYNISLIVQYPPEIVVTLDEYADVIEIAKGTKASLHCEVKGEPKPHLTWSRNNTTIQYSNNVYLNGNSLTIDNASENESGHFSCIASNILGSVQKSFTVLVYLRPIVINPKMDREINLLEGDVVELPCSVQGVPEPIIEWRHNEIIIDKELKQIDDQFTLKFIANLTDIGDYQCVAKNDYGNANRSYYVYIWATPEIEGPWQITKDMVLGSNASVQCNALGFPIPTISWELNHMALTQNSSGLSFDDVGNLFISNVTTDHNGLLVCTADNIVGYSEKIYHMTVNEPPKILPENYTGPYIATNLDTVLIIPCRVIGTPTPVVSWTKDHKIFLKKDAHYTIDVYGSLIITALEEGMNGNYTCIAKNSVGEVNKTVSVVIYSLPKPIQADESVHTVTLVEGSSDVINCPIHSSYGDSVQWYKDGVLLSEGQLVISNVSRLNAATYACVVTNVAGSAFMSIHLDVEWPPSVLNNYTRYIEIDRGYDVYLDCHVDAKPKPMFVWSYNSSILMDETEDYLKLLNVKSLDDGEYTCEVSNKHGSILRQFNLEVLTRPHISDFDFLEVRMKEGQNATLFCNATGWPTPEIYWDYNNTNWIVQNTSLINLNTTLYSNGLFKCTARNKIGVASIIYQFTVVVPATIRDIVLYDGKAGINVKDKIDIQSGTYARIACEASGTPTPYVQWLRNGKMVNDSNPNTYYADLIFLNIDNSHSGSYVCITSNEVAKEEKKIVLNVLEPPKILTSLFYESNVNETIIIEVLLSESLYLHCHPYGKPVPEIYWFKNGESLRFFDDRMVSTEFGEILVSKSASEDMSGNYTCVARNSVSETAVTYLVDVLVPPPRIKENLATVISRMGKRIELNCPMEGNPIPVPYVFWVKFPYTEISADLFPRINLIENNHTLIITDADVADNGKYSCVITNKVGTAEMIFDVIIEKPPTIMFNVRDNNTEKHTFHLGRNVILKCVVDGYPQPKITWLKNTIKLSENLSNVQRALSNSILTIWQVRVSDAGQYICLAENNAGSEYRRFDVRVKVPGKWSVWSHWSLCNVSCGLGHQHRTRSCQYVGDDVMIGKNHNNSYVLLDESACKGHMTDRRKCHMPVCENENAADGTGRWLGWSSWSDCSATCGIGIMTRSRRCRPSTAKCQGDNLQIRKCPDLPKCSATEEASLTQNIVTDTEVNITNPYSPIATFEMQPETLDPNLIDVDTLNTDAGHDEDNTPKRRYFDIIVTENIDNTPIGVCKAGYTYNLLIGCEDIDECLFDNNQCHSTQLCRNTPGGYGCYCPSGYMALGAAQRCLDINECEQETHRCEYACVNVAGGYVCACPKHMRLHDDKLHCIGDSSHRNLENLDYNEILSAAVDVSTKYRNP